MIIEVKCLGCGNNFRLTESDLDFEFDLDSVNTIVICSVCKRRKTIYYAPCKY
jgi:hypothetical protein